MSTIRLLQAGQLTCASDERSAHRSPPPPREVRSADARRPGREIGCLRIDRVLDRSAGVPES